MDSTKAQTDIGARYIFERTTMRKQRVPSLVNLCVQVAIDNVRYLGDVEETDFHLLERILPRCTLDQLVHIENCTEGTDLGPVTNKLWKKFYERQFGAHNTNVVIERMRKKKAKSKDMEEAQQKSIDRLRQLYQKEDGKQSRQVQVCTKIPPSSRKRTFCGGVNASNICNTKSGLMKKAKLEFLNSQEVKNLAATKSKVVQRNHSVTPVKKPVVSPRFAASSSSKTR
ncbi:transcription elongation factor B polypeptide 3 [Olea europaea subsp. europaea]|uniref:Transcription elongation factor B polypeptide 3 n=1 Tax=Olea europaea subsp. europaea TaxID=158383 RepID=A0A8S0QEA5_OLEEU|nr:transcription elongation factor B polypeptide 3 [Olea europaea subsp. europaea]